MLGMRVPSSKGTAIHEERGGVATFVAFKFKW
jgi:hypothetical protein